MIKGEKGKTSMSAKDTRVKPFEYKYLVRNKIYDIQDLIGVYYNYGTKNITLQINKFHYPFVINFLLRTSQHNILSIFPCLVSSSFFFFFTKYHDFNFGPSFIF